MAGTAGTVGIEEALAHGRALLRADPVSAAAQAREIVRVDPRCADGWRLLGQALRRLGSTEEAEEAEIEAVAASVYDPELLRAGEALVANQIPVAERLLRQRLKDNPLDVAAIRMLAEVAARIGRYKAAEALLRRALELAPAFTAARANLATVVYKQSRPAEAVEILDALPQGDEALHSHQNLKAAALGRLGSYDEAIGIYRKVLERTPDQPKVWMSLGHSLKTVGRQQEGVEAYRQALELAPSLGEVWWSLANLKTVPLSDSDVDAMELALGRPDLSREDELHLHFALAKALEERGRFERAFSHYDKGNALRRETIGYDPESTSDVVDRSKRLFTAAFFEERRSHGASARDPIFILGMPRAGSTLIEQILASHPMVEGTMELPDMPALARRFGSGISRADGPRYPDKLASLDQTASRQLGEEFIERTRVQRKTDRPFFIDKLPNNWIHLGLIQLILPNAKVIDARRHPLDCCFSNFKQHYARGQPFSYSLETMGLYYRDYVELMAHFDAVLPGRVHRVIHEALVDDPETEVRRLLDYLGLDFDPACLRFHENKRPVRTASSEQVRRPLNRDGIGRWRDFDPWLTPLKEALGPVASSYPEVPA